MAMASCTTKFSANFANSGQLNKPVIKNSDGVVKFSGFKIKKVSVSLSLSSSHCICQCQPLASRSLFSAVASPPSGNNPQPVSIVAAKGYKMKTHKMGLRNDITQYTDGITDIECDMKVFVTLFIIMFFASAKRFRVTGSGKIIRRRAGKQHLLAKKNNKRKLRLSKMLQVDRSDYNNVIGALPYLKLSVSDLLLYHLHGFYGLFFCPFSDFVPLDD
ncbi:large ribosomal subunit protein bL35c-like [Daucus carota subsp. sativus]|uniref:large ribosomal subunit protein bL35c-like n=1 Tax=Daucus carota subsp. sativus TaxID=79200 RepID=UPI003082BAD8